MMKNEFPIIFRELEFLYNLVYLPQESLKRDIAEKEWRLCYSISEKDIRLILLKNVSNKIGWSPILSIDEGHNKLLEIHFYKILSKKDKIILRKKKKLIWGGENKFSLKGTNRIMAIKYFCIECEREIENKIRIFSKKANDFLNKMIFKK